MKKTCLIFFCFVFFFFGKSKENFVERKTFELISVPFSVSSLNSKSNNYNKTYLTTKKKKWRSGNGMSGRGSLTMQLPRKSLKLPIKMLPKIS